jgi:hypothetical protein
VLPYPLYTNSFLQESQAENRGQTEFSPKEHWFSDFSDKGVGDQESESERGRATRTLNPFFFGFHNGAHSCGQPAAAFRSRLAAPCGIRLAALRDIAGKSCRPGKKIFDALSFECCGSWDSCDTYEAIWARHLQKIGPNSDERLCRYGFRSQPSMSE